MRFGGYLLHTDDGAYIERVASENCRDGYNLKDIYTLHG